MYGSTILISYERCRNKNISSQGHSSDQICTGTERPDPEHCSENERSENERPENERSETERPENVQTQ